MAGLFVGVCHISLLFRFAQSAKDKHRALQGVKQRLRKSGFSVTECGDSQSPRRASLGLAYTGDQANAVDQAIEEALRVFTESDFEVLETERDLFNYSELEVGEPSEESQWRYGD